MVNILTFIFVAFFTPSKAVSWDFNTVLSYFDAAVYISDRFYFKQSCRRKLLSVLGPDDACLTVLTFNADSNRSTSSPTPEPEVVKSSLLPIIRELKPDVILFQQSEKLQSYKHAGLKTLLDSISGVDVWKYETDEGNKDTAVAYNSLIFNSVPFKSKFHVDTDERWVSTYLQFRTQYWHEFLVFSYHNRLKNTLSGRPKTHLAREFVSQVSCPCFFSSFTITCDIYLWTDHISLCRLKRQPKKNPSPRKGVSQPSLEGIGIFKSMRILYCLNVRLHSHQP